MDKITEDPHTPVLGIIYKLSMINSKHGGVAYRTFVYCHDAKERVLWIDPTMDNYDQWEDFVNVMEHPKFNNKCLVVDGLRKLKRKDKNLNADCKPFLVDTIDMQDFRYIKVQLQ